MIIPSIDIMDGQAVQLVGGKEKKLDAGDPIVIAERFGIAGEIAVVDLDAALGRGNNKEIIKKLLRIAPCRVGGGIRDVNAALEWLDLGATKIVIGTRAVPEVLKELPKDRVIAALDAENDEVVVDGWREKTGRTVLSRMEEIRDLVSGFLVTFVEKEGRMGGTQMHKVAELVAAAGNARLTIAGGVTTAEEIGELDRLGADAQVGMAIYTGKLGLADAIVAPLTSERSDGLWPTVVVDESGKALGLCWSSAESVNEAVRTQSGVYHSRKRGIWRKGETSGATQELIRIFLDCDRDALCFKVRQKGDGFCHLKTDTCWGDELGFGALQKRIEKALSSDDKNSYTKRLLADPKLLRSKLLEEAKELADASGEAEVKWEAADLLYFVSAVLREKGVSLAEVEAELDFRALKISRRGGDAKS